MASAFMYNGPKDLIYSYLKSHLSEQYHTMIDCMSPEWRNAVVYVMGRSKSSSYLTDMMRAYDAGVLDKISPDTVKSGSGEGGFGSAVDVAIAEKLV